MGSVCCCFQGPDVEENVGSNGSNNGNFTCLSFFTKNLMNKFGKGEMHAIPSSILEAISVNSTVAPNNMPFETNRSRDGHLGNNPNSQNSQFQQDGVDMRHGNGTSHSDLDPEPLRSSNVKISPKPFSGRNTHSGSYCEGGSKNCYSESSVKALLMKGSVYPSSEDADACPTCLEEYTPDNPKIITKCSHHYHLSCIYEWMERSKNCPVCGKLMAFDEMT